MFAKDRWHCNISRLIQNIWRISPMTPWPRTRQTLTFADETSSENCACEFCRRNKSFQAPSELLDAFLEGTVVIFAGAGISTEAKSVMPNTLYTEINHALGNKNSDRAFPDLMEDFCATPAGKIGLIQRIRDHFDYAYSHSSIYSDATRFHNELATFYPVDTIVTSNWDDYFEQHCSATPFIEDRDIALWPVAQRKVLKIHGSISNYGSIVATRADYRACENRLQSGLLGAHLKSLLSTKTIVFVGYSLRDEDFLQIYGAVREGLKDFHRQAYFVAPEIGDDDRTRLKELNLHFIETDGTFFIQQVKRMLERKFACALTRCTTTSRKRYLERLTPTYGYMTHTTRLNTLKFYFAHGIKTALCMLCGESYA
jgi:hypothetical protein